MLSNEEIRSYVETAFTPYRCVAEIQDYNQKLGLRVFDLNDAILATVEAIVLSTIRDKNSLDSLVQMIQQRIDNKKRNMDMLAISTPGSNDGNTSS